MLYKNLRNHSLFLTEDGSQICRKHSDAFSVVVVGHRAGHDAILGAKDRVTPISSATVAETFGISPRYL